MLAEEIAFDAIRGAIVDHFPARHFAAGHKPGNSH